MLSFITNNIAIVVFIIQLLFIIFVIFFDYKKPVNTLAWVAFFAVIPFVSIVFYILFGNRMRFRKNKAFRAKQLKDNTLNQLVISQLNLVDDNSLVYQNPQNAAYNELIRMNLIFSDGVLTQNNKIETFTCGEEKFPRLIEDLKSAKHSIHLLYYIYRDDELGNEIMQILTEKAKNGVEVRLIYDDFGSLLTRRKFFQPLKDAGGEVNAFLPSKFIFNIRVNYRNHRKIAVIDGKIAYLGGMNIGKEYANQGKLAPWRDTHIRVTGNAVYMLQTRFLLDWTYASEKDAPPLFIDNYFKPIEPEDKGTTAMQIVASGPDSREEQIKKGFIKMISEAKEQILIQSPYFIPDDTLLEALEIASLSGVRITIILPGKYDKFLVYCGTLSYIKPLLEYGVDFYLYDGFIHSKMVVMDDKIVSLGTANIDIRSFALDFEVNAFIYDSDYTKQIIEIFNEDLVHSTYLSAAAYASRRRIFKIMGPIARLVSPLL